jgi:hypothetical protein
MGIAEYILVQRANSDAIARNSPCFRQVLVPLDRSYEEAATLVPADAKTIFGMLFLLCHRAFLSASTLIAQAQPDDAGPITRRALETSKLALAVKRNPQNYDHWLAYEQRAARWAARRVGNKPGRPVSPRYDCPKGPLLDEIEAHIGVLSDAFAHFTPEFYGTQPWEVTDTGSAAILFHSYFTQDCVRMSASSYIWPAGTS